MNRYPRLSEADLPHALRLIRSENLGPVTFFKLLEYYGSAKRAVDAVPDLARRNTGKKPIALAAADAIREEIERTQAHGATFLLYGAPGYPDMLLPLADPPPVLIAYGSLSLLEKETVGIVGTRNASANGWNFARKLATELGDAGIAIASGMARGIDAAAHEGALPTGTVAVMASGINVCYPPEHQKLYDGIAAQGLLLTEQPFGQEPFSHSFPSRNRIISGLSRGVVVVEAAVRSGTLITAACALEQGREVFAVPGSPFDPRCRGSNDLLRQGAILTESAADVMTVLREGRPRTALFEMPAGGYLPEDDTPLPNPEDAREALLALLSPSPVLTDDLIAQTGLAPRAAVGALLELELSGCLQRLPGGKVVLVGE